VAEPLATGILTALFLLMAVLYSSVGMGGGSGYLAAMALVGLAPENIRLTALSLNVVVASIGVWRFSRAGFLAARLWVPFVVASVPAAFLGGALSLPPGVFRPLLALILLWAATLLWRPVRAEAGEAARPPLVAALASGAGIGVLSGLVGVGGGIFLAPLLILRRWATPRSAAATTASFILANSLAALAGISTHTRVFSPLLPLWMGVVAVGGWIGAEMGARWLSSRALRRILTIVLVIAGLRMAVG